MTSAVSGVQGSVFILHTPPAVPLNPEDNAHVEGPLTPLTYHVLWFGL